MVVSVGSAAVPGVQVDDERLRAGSTQPTVFLPRTNNPEITLLLRLATPLYQSSPAAVAEMVVDAGRGRGVQDLSAVRDRMHEGLRTMRSALGGHAYVHARFSYADILIATALHLIAPVAERFVPIDPTLRRIWKDDELAREFSDLIG